MNKYPLVVVAGEVATMVEVKVARYRLLPSKKEVKANAAELAKLEQRAKGLDKDKLADEARVIRTDARYQELRQLTAVANYRAAKEFKVSQKVSAPVNHETVAVVCSKTGMTVEIIMPKIPGVVLEYTNPLSLYANIKGILAKGAEYLNKLDAQILAGMWLTAYRHYDIVAKQTERGPDAVALNAMLRTAGKTILIDGLELIDHINSNNCHRLPRFSLDYNAHKEFTSLGPALQEHNRAIRAVIYPTAESFYAKSKEAKELVEIESSKYQDDTSYVVKAATKTKLSSAEREYEEKFVANRREAKQILARLVESREIPSLFIAKLKPVFIGKNLVAMAAETRKTVANKLRSFKSVDAQRLAVIVEEGHNPYDIFADIDDAFSSNEANLKDVASTQPTAKLSLAQILAMKKAGTFGQAVVPSEAAEPVTSSSTVKLTYTEDDEIRHMEIEESLDAGNIISDEDAAWNNEYLRVKEGQEANDVDTSGEDF